jgi:diacylglycerol kinase family enzyme
VYNPVKVDIDRLRPAVELASVNAGLQPTQWFETSTEDAGFLVTQEALKQNPSVVIAAGGDGTVREVAEALRGTGVPLALVPSGTGYLLARNLEHPLSNIEESVRIALSGAERAIDIGVARLTRAEGTGESSDGESESGESEHSFLVMAGLGIDAAMVANTSSSLKDKVGWLAYVDGTMRSLATLEKIGLRYAIDRNIERTAHVSSILIANCGSLPGNIELIPDAKIDDGLLDIAVLQPKTLLGWLMIWRAVTWENRVLRRTALGREIIKHTGTGRSNTLTYLRGATVRLAVDAPQPFELDGDPFGDVSAVELTVDPGALLVKVPQSAATAASSEPAAKAESADPETAEPTPVPRD